MNLELFKTGYKRNLESLLVEELMAPGNESEEKYADRETRMAHFNSLVEELGKYNGILIMDGEKETGYSLNGEEFYFADKVPREVFESIFGEDMKNLDYLAQRNSSNYAKSEFIGNERRMEKAFTSEPFIFKAGKPLQVEGKDYMTEVFTDFLKVVYIENDEYFTDVLDNFFMFDMSDVIDIDDTALTDRELSDDVEEYRVDDSQIELWYSLRADDRLNDEGWKILFSETTDENGQKVLTMLPLVQADNGLILTHKEFLAMCDTLGYLKYEILGVYVDGEDFNYYGTPYLDEETTRELNEKMFDALLVDTEFYDKEQNWDVLKTKEVVNDTNALYLRINNLNGEIVEMVRSDDENAKGSIDINIYDKDGTKIDHANLNVKDASRPLKSHIEDALNLCGYILPRYEFINKEVFESVKAKSDVINCITRQDMEQLESKKGNKGEER